MLAVTSDILDQKEVADMLKVSTRTVMRLTDQKELHGFKVGKRWRYYRSDVEAYIEAQRRKALEEE